MSGGKCLTLKIHADESDRHTETDRQAEKQAKRPADRWTDVGIQTADTERHTDKQKHTDRQAYRHAYSQTNRFL